MRYRKGFTLIELLVVVAIIALLLSIVVPSLRVAKETAKRIVCASNMKSLGQGIFVYASHYDDRLVPPTNGSNLYHTHLVYRIDRSQPFGEHIYATYGLGYLHRLGIIESPEAYYCPSAPRVVEGTTVVSFRYEDFLDASGRWPWNSDPSGVSMHNVRSSFNYTPQSKNQRITMQVSAQGPQSFPAVARKASELFPGYALATDILFRLDTLPHTRGFRNPKGVNLLYSDGSVSFRNNPEAFDPDVWRTELDDDYRFRVVLGLLQ